MSKVLADGSRVVRVQESESVPEPTDAIAGIQRCQGAAEAQRKAAGRHSA